MFEAWTLRQESVHADDEKLRSAIRALTDPQRAEFFKKYNKALKDPDTFAVLNWFFLAGLHHFYLGRFIRGSLNLLIMVFGMALLFSTPIIGSALIAGIVLIEMPALFRSQIIVENYNTNLGRRILDTQQ